MRGFQVAGSGDDDFIRARGLTFSAQLLGRLSDDLVEAATLCYLECGID